MKLKSLVNIIACLLVASTTLPLYAAQARILMRQANLIQAYYQALKSDPTFKKARADWESAKENLPIARAAYLTQIAITGNLEFQTTNLGATTGSGDSSAPTSGTTGAGATTFNSDYGFILSVTQPIFNLPAWNAIKSARASVKAATATFSSAGQDLMLRTVKAYVAVLQAYDQLRFQLARKRAVLEQLKVARQQFKVGLIAITGVYDARSVYDQAVAQSIADQNTLNDAVEELAEITGIHYSRLLGIGKPVPLITPQPNDINVWANTAERQNYRLIAQNYTVLSTREIIKQQATSWLPQVGVGASYINDNVGGFEEEGGQANTPVPALHTDSVMYGFTLNIPLVQGGLVTASTRQAEYNYLSASSQREFIYRSVVSDTRQSFLGIITGISKIRADWQSVISAQNALSATKAGYKVGTRTMVDVLDDVTSLYQAQQQYANDQYAYLIDTIELKFNAGTLKVSDLQKINRWLKRRIILHSPEQALKTLQSHLKPLRPLKAKHQQSISTSISSTVSIPKAFTSVRNKEQQQDHKPQRQKQRHQNRRANVAAIKHQNNEKSKALDLDLPAPTRDAPTDLDLPAPKQVQQIQKVQKKAMKTIKMATPAALSSDEQVIPLYDGPRSNQRLLPHPTV